MENKDILLKIERDVEYLKSEISEIKSLLKFMNNSYQKMNDHISFIEETYNNFSYPLNIFKNSIEKIFPNNSIENKK